MRRGGALGGERNPASVHADYPRVRCPRTATRGRPGVALGAAARDRVIPAVHPAIGRMPAAGAGRAFGLYHDSSRGRRAIKVRAMPRAAKLSPLPVPVAPDLPPSLLPTRDGIPWRERPFLPVASAAALVGCSRAQLYKLAAEGRIGMAKLAGRTLVPTPTLIALLESAKAFVPGGCAPKGGALARTRERQADAALLVS